MTEWSRRNFVRTAAAAGLALPAAPALAHAVGAPESGDDAGPVLGSRSRSDDDPLGIRGQFPVAEESAYLNTASTGPLPLPVREALVAYADEKMTYRDPASRRRAVDRARSRFANLFGADEEEIAFLFNTSDGENIVANSIDWRPGDNVVIDELHFTTAFVVYRELEKREGVELRIIPSREGRAHPEDYDAYTDDRTRLISVAWVSNRNGFRYDLPALAEIAHARGGYLFADGIQAFGTSRRTCTPRTSISPAATAISGSTPTSDARSCTRGASTTTGCSPTASATPRWPRRSRNTSTAEDGRAEVRAREPRLRPRRGHGRRPRLHRRGRAGADRRTHAGARRRTSRGSCEAGDETVHAAGQPVTDRELLPRDGPGRTRRRPARGGGVLHLPGGGELLRAAVAMFNNRADVDRLLGVIAARV